MIPASVRRRRRRSSLIEADAVSPKLAWIFYNDFILAMLFFSPQNVFFRQGWSNHFANLWFAKWFDLRQREHKKGATALNIALQLCSYTCNHYSLNLSHSCNALTLAAMAATFFKVDVSENFLLTRTFIFLEFWAATKKMKIWSKSP